MKAFDLEKALQGEPVITSKGWPVRLLCTDRVGIQPLVGLVMRGDEEQVWTWSLDGSNYMNGEASDMDLFMAPLEKSGWINLYKDTCGTVLPGCIYQTEKEALQQTCDLSHVDTIKITWKE